MVNHRKQGDIGLGAAIAFFTSAGYTVAIPLTDSQRFDLIVVKDDIMQRVQVKTTRYKGRSGQWELMLRTTGGWSQRKALKSFDATDAELLFAMTGERDIYLIPSSEIRSINTITLGSNHGRYERFKVESLPL